MKPSPAVLRSLQIFRDACGEIRPTDFAHRYFTPDDPIWKRMSKCGPKGATRGQVPVMWAGGWLGKLRRAGLIKDSYNAHYGCAYLLSEDGRQMLENNR